jgi:hypothetical protein
MYLQTAGLRPSFALVRDHLIRGASDRIFDEYRLDPSDRTTIASQFEPLLFELLDVTDQIAAAMAEHASIKRRMKRHRETHPACSFPGCRPLGAMFSRLDALDVEIGRGIAALARLRL